MKLFLTLTLVIFAACGRMENTAKQQESLIAATLLESVFSPVILEGDSISWDSRLAPMVQNASSIAVPGSKARDVLNRAQLVRSADTMFLLIGTNDRFVGMDSQSWETAVTVLRPKFRRFFCVSVLPTNGDNTTIQQMNAYIKQHCPGIYLDLYSEFTSNEFRTVDGLHLNESGNARLAQAYNRAMELNP